MGKDAKGHGSNSRGMAAGRPTYSQAATAAKKFAKQPTISDRVAAAKGTSRREQHADPEKYEAARQSGDRYKMAAESIKLSRRAQRASDVRATTKNKKY